MEIDIETARQAYCFFHQKLRVLDFSTIDRQKDEIEDAILSYADKMDRGLFGYISEGDPDFLHVHERFHAQLRRSVELLERFV